MRADFVNERCCNVFGTHAEELLGFGWLDFLDRADVEAAEIGLAQVIEELREARPALRLHSPYGRVRPEELCAAPVAANGRDSGFGPPTPDITPPPEPNHTPA